MLQTLWLIHPDGAMCDAFRHYREPPHRLDWDFVIERQKANHYDGDQRVSR